MKLSRIHFIRFAKLIGQVSVESNLNHKQEANLTDQVIFMCREGNSQFDVDIFQDAIEKAKINKEKDLTHA